MPALIVLFNLKDENSRADYERWANTTDVPTVKGLPSVDDFKVYRNTSLLGSEAAPPYQYVEVILVNDMGQLGADVSTARMQQVAAEFQQFADNPIFMVAEQIA